MQYYTFPYPLFSQFLHGICLCVEKEFSLKGVIAHSLFCFVSTRHLNNILKTGRKKNFPEIADT